MVDTTKYPATLEEHLTEFFKTQTDKFSIAVPSSYDTEPYDMVMFANYDVGVQELTEVKSHLDRIEMATNQIISVLEKPLETVTPDSKLTLKVLIDEFGYNPDFPIDHYQRDENNIDLAISHRHQEPFERLDRNELMTVLRTVSESDNLQQAFLSYAYRENSAEKQTSDALGELINHRFNPDYDAYQIYPVSFNPMSEYVESLGKSVLFQYLCEEGVISKAQQEMLSLVANYAKVPQEPNLQSFIEQAKSLAISPSNYEHSNLANQQKEL